MKLPGGMAARAGRAAARGRKLAVGSPQGGAELEVGESEAGAAAIGVASAAIAVRRASSEVDPQPATARAMAARMPTAETCRRSPLTGTR
jgi:hypothetical protein